MSSVLVTGGTGFIGSWVTRQLVDQGVRVVTYSRHPDTALIKDIADKVDCVAGDVLDLPRLIHTIKHYGVERIIHMSTLLIGPLEANPFMAYRVNVDGTMNILEAARLMDIKRVVFISSKAAYDIARGEYAPPTCQPIDEDYPKAPQTIYGATKFFMENMGLNYNRIYGLDFISLKFTTTYGIGKQVRHGALGLHSKIIESAMLGRLLKVSQDVDQPNDMIYNKDAANSIVLACFAENLEHRIFHVGKGKGETLRHMIEIVNNVFGGALIEIDQRPETKSSPNSYIFNIDRARRELGFSPQYNLEESIRDYIETMRRLDITPVVLP